MSKMTDNGKANSPKEISDQSGIDDDQDQINPQELSESARMVVI